MKYFKTLNLYKNSSASCTFNPKTMEAHSYRWWVMAKVIKGQFVLNSYRYSNVTAKHIQKCRTLFDQLGLEYVELPSPQGLQDLDSAKAEVLRNYGDTLVRNSYARGEIWDEVRALDRIQTAKELGIKITAKELVKAHADAETRREKRLKRARDRKAADKARVAALAKLAEKPSLRLVGSESA